jgi:hypothetical protein
MTGEPQSFPEGPRGREPGFALTGLEPEAATVEAQRREGES